MLKFFLHYCFRFTKLTPNGQATAGPRRNKMAKSIDGFDEAWLREASSAELFFAQGILEHLLALVRAELEDRYPLVPLRDGHRPAEARP